MIAGGQFVSGTLYLKSHVTLRLAAEAALLAGRPEPPATPAVETQEIEMQQHSIQSPMKDEALKRATRKHPQRDIPRIEGIDPQDAPLKE